jgi:hypothetical protein
VLEALTGWITGLGASGFIIFVALIYFFIKQRKAQEYDTPPLDLVDAKKLDLIVSAQVHTALASLLKSEGYNEEQINQILVRQDLDVNVRIFPGR